MNSLKALGHEVEVFTDHIPRAGDVAILNLGELGDDAKPLVEGLKAEGVYVIAHAGHKEGQLHALGQLLRCDRLATNSELTWKLPDILAGADV